MRRVPWLGLVLLGGIACAVPDRPAEPRAGSASPDPSRHEVTADDGHPLTVWEKRPEEAPRGVVLLLHGRTWSSLPDFDLRVPGEDLSLMDGLTEAGFAVYALDARGYGGTPRDDSGWLTPDRMALDVTAVLRWLQERESPARRPALVGWSFGSTVAHLAAQRHPELVSGVVLYGFWKDPEGTLPADTFSGPPPRHFNTAGAAASDFIAPGAISAAAVHAYVDQALEADPVRVDIAHVEQFNALDPGALAMPVLILQGELDPIGSTPIQAHEFEALGTGDKEWVVLGGCDHAALLERCRPRFLRALAGFVGEVTGPRNSEASGGV